MVEITALVVNLIPVANNFIYLHSKLLNRFRNASNPSGCVEIKHDKRLCYGSCYATPYNVNGENAFNISAAFAKSLSLEESSTVIVSSVEAKSLKFLHVTPFSSDDWEILENSADTIQNSLLNQIRVVGVHQNLTVWVSKSISVMIHIDQLSEDNAYGVLENFTEVIVSTEVRPCTSCSSESSPKSRSVNSWSSFFKDLISFVAVKEETPDESKPEICESEFSFSKVFRCCSIDLLEFQATSSFSTYPFNVFVSKKHFQHERIKNRGIQLCRLKQITSGSSKSLKDDKSDQTEDITSFATQEIYVHLHILEDMSTFQPTVHFRSANCYPTIFVSDTIRDNFGLKRNSKVKLDVVKKSVSCNVTEINFSSSHEMKTTVDDIRSFYNAYTQVYDEVIINNYCSMNICGEVLYFSFNPLNIPYVEMSYDDVQKCNFVSVERKIETNVNAVEEKPFSLDLLNFSFYKDVIQELHSTVLLELGFLRNLKNESSVVNSNHVIVEGDSGSGKTSLVKLLGDELAQSNYGVFVKIVECKSLKGKLVAKLKTIFESIFRECVHFQPSVIIFDDLDVMFVTSKQSDQQHNEKSVSSYTNRLSTMLSDLIRSYVSHQITVMATATNISSFESSLYSARGAPIFSIKKRLPALDQNARRESLLQFLTEKYHISINTLKSEYLDDVVQRLEGYCIQDISDLVDRIYFEAIKRQVKICPKIDQISVNEQDVDTAVSEIVPVSLKGVDFHKNSSITWKNVGGLDTAKQLLTEILIWPSKYPKVFKQCPLKMPSGVLLYGAPGSGKTLLAGAVAGESSLNFISIKGPELLSKYVGESEEGVRNTFRRAQNAKPCILFFDEFESLAPRRGNDITGVTDRVVNQLLTELDGVESVSGVWVLAATSRPDLIDPALLRPGRLGSMVYCPLPNQDERLSILKVICSSTEILEDVDLHLIAQVTEGFTGADLQAVFYTAHMKNCRVDLISAETDLEMSEENDTKLRMESLIEAVKETKPSLKMEERLNYERIYQRFSHNDENMSLELEKQRLTYA
ncbi:peroxisomal ATPase PEX1 [Planococcus citri]|uniref:peroxisomal ATPase PEX1 n=1 Tax=Planococcus citri TaxID=170843 RepID=UPI0031FA0266